MYLSTREVRKAKYYSGGRCLIVNFPDREVRFPLGDIALTIDGLTLSQSEMYDILAIAHFRRQGLSGSPEAVFVENIYKELISATTSERKSAVISNVSFKNDRDEPTMRIFTKGGAMVVLKSGEIATFMESCIFTDSQIEKIVEISFEAVKAKGGKDNLVAQTLYFELWEWFQEKKGKKAC